MGFAERISRTGKIYGEPENSVKYRRGKKYREKNKFGNLKAPEIRRAARSTEARKTVFYD